MKYSCPKNCPICGEELVAYKAIATSSRIIAYRCNKAVAWCNQPVFHYSYCKNTETDIITVQYHSGKTQVYVHYEGRWWSEIWTEDKLLQSAPSFLSGEEAVAMLNKFDRLVVLT